ncbi:MAG TPA: HNH endonuclease [Patescibacteria group bacterium]|nr:HNH endonuclease [Patescibacteria group bacterium]
MTADELKAMATVGTAALRSILAPPRHCRACGAELPYLGGPGRPRQWCDAHHSRVPTRQGSTRRCLDCSERFGPPRRGPWAERCSRCRMRRKWDLDPHHRLPETLRRAVIARDGHRCGICGRPVDPALRGSHPLALSIDHVVPIVAAGDDSLGNLQVAHLGCNAAKGNSLPAWMAAA